MNHPKFVLILNTPHTVLLHRGKICMCFVFNMKSVLLARLTEVLNFHLSSLKVILHLLVYYELCIICLSNKNRNNIYIERVYILITIIYINIYGPLDVACAS